MNRLLTLIDSMNYKDLKALEKDLYEGNIGKLIKKNLEQHEYTLSSKNCATCGTQLKEPSYTLEFGRNDFKKRAVFCGLDCLSFFVAKLERESKLRH